MPYTLPHFMRYRFGLYNYATSEAGGHVDFDYFRITGKPVTLPLEVTCMHGTQKRRR